MFLLIMYGLTDKNYIKHVDHISSDLVMYSLQAKEMTSLKTENFTINPFVSALCLTPPELWTFYDSFKVLNESNLNDLPNTHTYNFY